MNKHFFVLTHKYSRFTIAIIFFLYFDTFSAYAPDSVKAKLYLSANEFNTVVIYGDTMWGGSLDGGVVRGCLSKFDDPAIRDNIVQLTTDDGLSNNFINKLAVDNTGILWVGTDSGVCRISPAGIDKYIYAGSKLMKNVEDLAVLGNRVAAVHENGIAVFTGSKFEDAPGLSQVRGVYNHIAFDKDTTLWIVGGRYDGAAGVLKSDKFGKNVTPIPYSFMKDSICDIITDTLKNVFIALGDSVACYNGKEWIFYSTADGSLAHPACLCVKNFMGGISVAGITGISHFKDGMWEEIPFGEYEKLERFAMSPAGYQNIQDVAFYDTSFFVFASKSPLTRWDGKYFTWHKLSYIEDNNIVFCAVDANDNLLMCPFGYQWGLHCFDGKQWTYYSKYTYPLFSDTHCFAIDSNGGYWFGSEYGLTYMKDGIWRSFQSITESGIKFYMQDGKGGRARCDGVLPVWRAADFLVAPDSTLWAACYGGILHYSDSTWKLYDTADGLPEAYICALALSKEGTIIAGSFGGVSMLVGDKFIPDTSSGTPSDKPISSLKVTSSGHIVASALGGGWYIKQKNGTWKVYNDIRGDVFIDDGDRLWCESAYGVYVFDTNGTELLHLTTDGGFLPSNIITSIAQCRNGTVWVGTSNGLAAINVFWPTSINPKKQKPQKKSATSVSTKNLYGTWDLQGRMIPLQQKKQLPANGVYIVKQQNSGIKKKLQLQESSKSIVIQK